MIACKHEEIDLPKVDDFIYITDNAYTRNEVFQMENDVLNKLNFSLLFPSPIKFFEFLANGFDFNNKQLMMGKYLMETFLIKAAQLIVAFAILVIIHEFGHYIFSRIFGVKVEKFYLFFNPWFTLYKYKPKKPAPKPGEEEKMTWRDTEYGIGWVPLGGYCKIAGMIDESMDTEQMKQPAKPWEFRSKPAWQRLLIMVGGVLFNFILAIIIYTGIVFAWGEKYIPFRNATEGMMYSETAHKVGFVDGDIPLAADGKELTYYSGDELLKMLDAKVVTVLRNKCDTVNINIPDGFIFTANKEAEEGNLFMAYRLPVVISDLQPGMGAVKA